MVSGPGEVNIERPDSAITWCSVTLPGKYEFKIVVTGKQTSEARVKVNVLKSDNKIEVECHFCGEKYKFTKQDFEGAF